MQPSAIDNEIDKATLLKALTHHPVGISFLQWLTRLTGANRPTMSMEDAARRDIWLTIRQYIPIEKLAEIEFQELIERQEHIRELLEQTAIPEQQSKDQEEEQRGTSHA